MSTKRLPADFDFLPEMYGDSYYPVVLVNKLKSVIQETVSFLENGAEPKAGIQAELDKMTRKINDLQEEFEDNDSEIETVARESIAATVERILHYFEINIELEEALRERDW